MEKIKNLLKILKEKGYIDKQKEFDDSIFIATKYEPVFSKIIEVAKEQSITIDYAPNSITNINPTPFDNIGPYNIALYDIEKINNIFNDIDNRSEQRGWDLYDMAYHWNSGIFHSIRMTDLNQFRAEMKHHEFLLLKENIDVNKMKIKKQEQGCLGGFPIVITISNVEEEQRRKKMFEEKNKEVNEFINNLEL